MARNIPIQPSPPVENSKPSMAVFLWRYTTGNHLDGKARTNATWFTRGTAPSHHVNWWSSKPRSHRMIWRWAIIAIPAGLIAAYKFAPAIHINLTLLVGLMFFPYLFHHGVMRFIRLIPRTHVVYVNDNISSDDIDYDNDTVTGYRPIDIPDLDDTQMTAAFDTAIENTEESDDVPSIPRKRRRA